MTVVLRHGDRSDIWWRRTQELVERRLCSELSSGAAGAFHREGNWSFPRRPAQEIWPTSVCQEMRFKKLETAKKAGMKFNLTSVRVWLKTCEPAEPATDVKKCQAEKCVFSSLLWCDTCPLSAKTQVTVLHVASLSWWRPKEMLNRRRHAGDMEGEWEE